MELGFPIQQPQFDLVSAQRVTQEQLPAFVAEALDREEVLEVLLDRISCPELETGRLDWKSCRLEGCRLPGLRAEGSYFGDVEFVNCDLSGAVLRDCSFAKVRFQGCRLTGANLFGTVLRDTVFRECVADFTVFTEARGKAVCFAECKLDSASFDAVTLKDFAFRGCSLAGVNFLRTQLNGQDLRTNGLEGAMFAEYELRGAVVTPLQAMELARLLGVVIED